MKVTRDQTPLRPQPADADPCMAAGCASNEPFPLQVDVNVQLAADIRVFLPKEQTDSETARGSHERVLLFLQSLASHIDNAAGYAHRVSRSANEPPAKS